MKMIHIECLREWLNSKCTIKTNGVVKTYCWKAMECELCKIKLPDRVPEIKPDANLNEPKKYIDLIAFDKPTGEYMVMESVTQ
jgi:hypothetical protein